MKTTTAIIATLALAAFLSGCFVHAPPPDGPGIYRPAVHPSQAVVVQAEFYHSDIEWVLWEYYDWDYDVVYDLHHRYRYSDDEIALILFLAYHGHCQPVRIIQWRQSGIPWMTITTHHLRLQPDIFFVPVASTYRLGPPYGNAYGRYWKNPRTVVLSDSEMFSLVYLKTTCLAYNASPIDVIRLREQGHDFNYIVRTHRNEGHHIRTVHGRDVKDPPSKVRISSDKHDQGKGRPETGSDKDKPGKDKPKADSKPKPDKDKPTGNSGNRGQGGGNSGGGKGKK